MSNTKLKMRVKGWLRPSSPPLRPILRCTLGRVVKPMAKIPKRIATRSAAEQGDELEREMTRAEISRATELARVCMASDYQNCGI